MTHSSRRIGLAGIVLALWFAPAPARANLVTYFGQDLQPNTSSPAVIAHPNSDAANARFMARLTSGALTETFDTAATPAGQTTPFATTFGTVPPQTIATFTGTGTVTANSNGQLNQGRFAISGNQFFKTDQNFSITFNAPQAAFGFYGTDIADVGGRLTVTLMNGTQSTYMLPGTTGTAANGSVVFFGIVGSALADQFSSVTFNHLGSGNDDFGFDNMTIATLAQVIATPEPSTLISASIAVMVGLGQLRRRGAKAQRVA